MNTKVLKTLEYDKIIARLTALAGTQGGREFCARLEPMDDRTQIAEALKQTTDAASRLCDKGSVSFSGTADIRPAVSRAKLGSTLTAAELMSVSSTLGAAARVKNFGRHAEEEERDSLDAFFTALEPLTPLRQEIERCILSEEEIADDASPALRRIRRSIRSANDRIHTLLNSVINSTRSYLSDGIVTIRDGRYCIPVRTEYRQHVPGLVHDHSGSGSTVYIEPMAVVNLNNEIRELESQEKKEIEAILASLSNEAVQYDVQLITDYEILTRLDFIFARGSLSRSMKGTEPVLDEGHFLDIRQGRHPLLEAEHVVPIDVRLGDTYDLLVITGPNTGGKTVTLKTIGLLTLMAQSGLHIPAETGSRIAVFREVFADIGDEQSIEQSLSTFSSHMTNIVRIFDQADEDSLVLVDELGAGTDPTEGAALAIAILGRLHRQGIRTVATTHYSELKVYALSTSGVENASCEFDVATLRPTYRLLIGIPGKSNAFAISSRLGLPEEIIEDARSSIGRQDQALEDVIADLQDSRKQIEDDRRKIDELKRQLGKREEAMSAREEKTSAQKERILRESREEARKLLVQAKEIADQTIRDMRRQGLTVSRETEEQRNLLRKKIDELTTAEEELPSSGTAPRRPLMVGDRVLVRSLKLTGTVTALADSRGQYTIRTGVMQTKAPLEDLELQEEEDSAGGTVSGEGRLKMDKASTISTELNLIGMTVDEALPALDKYIDDAYLAHLKQARIIHGRGTGALRNAVRSYLRTSRLVQSYRPGEFDEGGYGVTVAVFREQ